MCFFYFYRRKGARGQSILESLLCMIVLCLILFGLLQIFNLAVAKMLTYYSAYRTSRSYSVGFADYLLTRSSQVAAIGGSGKLVEPDNREYTGLVQQFDAEAFMIPEYISGTSWLEYEYWGGENSYDPKYYNPNVRPPQTYLYRSSNMSQGGAIRTTVGFVDYPFTLFDLMDKDRIWFGAVGNATQIDGEATFINHSADYLE